MLKTTGDILEVAKQRRRRLVENKIRFISEERRDCSKCPGLNRYFCSRDFFGLTNCYLLRNPEQRTLERWLNA